MLDRSWTRGIALAAVAGGLALALAAAPLAPGAALAKGPSDNGADNSGGRAGGNGQGNSNSGAGGSAPGLVIGNAGVGGEDGPGNGHGLALGRDNDAVSGVDVSSQNGIHPENHGALASMLGRLNAAHASPNAMANAAPNSAVGLTAQYYDALAAGQTGDAAELLADLANKDVATDDVGTVVQAYNDLLGITVGEDDPPTGSGADYYSGFEISGDTEDDLIADAEDEYLEGIGGGLGPAP